MSQVKCYLHKASCTWKPGVYSTSRLTATPPLWAKDWFCSAASLPRLKAQRPHPAHGRTSAAQHTSSQQLCHLEEFVVLLHLFLLPGRELAELSVCHPKNSFEVLIPQVNLKIRLSLFMTVSSPYPSQVEFVYGCVLSIPSQVEFTYDCVLTIP